MKNKPETKIGEPTTQTLAEAVVIASERLNASVLSDTQLEELKKAIDVLSKKVKTQKELGLLSFDWQKEIYETNERFKAYYDEFSDNVYNLKNIRNIQKDIIQLRILVDKLLTSLDFNSFGDKSMTVSHNLNLIKNSCNMFIRIIEDYFIKRATNSSQQLMLLEIRIGTNVHSLTLNMGSLLRAIKN
jgi:hypothetical protein